MKVIEHLAAAKNPLFSFEVVPPPRGKSVREIIDVVQALSDLNPPWIDVTSHSSTAQFHEKPDGSIYKRISRKRPGTLGICGIIQNRFRIDTVAHILCLGFTREETEDALIELNFLGIHNVLALRGDAPNFQKIVSKDRSANLYASELVSQIKEISNGQFLSEPEDCEGLEFCAGVAGYPEKHIEAANIKLDIENLKKKVDAGADYIVTQMFFDNQKYFSFVKDCRAAGINVPIIPGLKVLRSVAQMKSLPKIFNIDLPNALVDDVNESPNHVSEIGQRWAHKQTLELLGNNVPCVHYYVLNDVNSVVDLVKKVQK